VLQAKRLSANDLAAFFAKYSPTRIKENSNAPVILSIKICPAVCFNKTIKNKENLLTMTVV
jgi:hypothetical protein